MKSHNISALIFFTLVATTVGLILTALYYLLFGPNQIQREIMAKNTLVTATVALILAIFSYAFLGANRSPFIQNLKRKGISLLTARVCMGLGVLSLIGWFYTMVTGQGRQGNILMMIAALTFVVAAMLLGRNKGTQSYQQSHTIVKIGLTAVTTFLIATLVMFFFAILYFIYYFS